MRSDVRKRVVGEEAGFTLTEVLVTMMIMLIVLFALYSIFDMSIRVFTFGNDKVEATEQARLGMEKMEREIRAAYPVDRINGKEHVFFSDIADPATSAPTLPEEQSITFGNDLPTPAGDLPPNRMVDPEEAITYELRNSDGIAACPNVGTEGICTVFRREGSGGTFEPLVEYVVPNNGNGEPGLTFEYFRNNMAPTTFADGTDIGVVRITLEVNVDGDEHQDQAEQTLTTDVDLRNRGG
jgi:prepilin-type N-terminal cleavage/methylation domain-containing protein